jgi:hypothetical protein
VWQASSLAPEEFARLQAEARKLLASEKEPAPRAAPDEPREEVTIREFGIVLRPTTREERAASLVVMGFTVDRVLPDAPATTFKAGDIIVCGETPYELVMTRGFSEGALRGIRASPAQNRPLHVIRGEQALSIVP